MLGNMKFGSVVHKLWSQTMLWTRVPFREYLRHTRATSFQTNENLGLYSFFHGLSTLKQCDFNQKTSILDPWFTSYAQNTQILLVCSKNGIGPYFHKKRHFELCEYFLWINNIKTMWFAPSDILFGCLPHVYWAIWLWTRIGSNPRKCVCPSFELKYFTF